MERNDHPNSRTGGASRLLPGARLGKYTIVRHLGSGGMGAVYEATHEIGKGVALNVLTGDASDAGARARFLREAKAVARIDHPHVVKVTDFGAEDSVPYIVMELLRGEDLHRRLSRQRGHPLAFDEAADIMLPLCSGIFAAHQKRVIHRDLKPSNVFLAHTPTGDVEPKVLDFGIAKMIDLTGSISLTDPGWLMGTPPYWAPEQAVGDRVTARTDQHALGVLLYECLTGQRPYQGNKAEIVERIRAGKFPPPSSLRPEFPRALETMILRAMARDPEARFQHVHALGAALLPFASAKKQVAWGDYYRTAPIVEEEKERAPLSQRFLAMAGPVPVLRSPTLEGRLALSTVQPQADDSLESRGPQPTMPETHTLEPLPDRESAVGVRAPRRWLPLWAVTGVLAVVAAVVLATFASSARQLVLPGQLPPSLGKSSDRPPAVAPREEPPPESPLLEATTRSPPPAREVPTSPPPRESATAEQSATAEREERAPASSPGRPPKKSARRPPASSLPRAVIQF